MNACIIRNKEQVGNPKYTGTVNRKKLFIQKILTGMHITADRTVPDIMRIQK